jgi:hypothetical protein
MPEIRHYEATDSRGIVFTRGTQRAGRHYTHCVVARGHCTFGDRAPFTEDEWTSSLDRAEANARSWRRKAHVTSVEVIEAHLVRTTGGAK